MDPLNENVLGGMNHYNMIPCAVRRKLISITTSPPTPPLTPPPITTAVGEGGRVADFLAGGTENTSDATLTKYVYKRGNSRGLLRSI